jgi:hypothetical protein
MFGAALFAIVCHGAIAQSAQELRVSTRFGPFTLGEGRMLLFKGHPLDPPLKGNSSIDVGEPMRIGETDVVLVTDIGGTACPFLYYFVIATKSGAKATSRFGTCNEATDVRRSGDSISLTMHGFLGPFEPEAQRKKALRQTHVFILRDGVVSEKTNLSKRKN